MTQSVKGTRTEENLKAAFAGESQAKKQSNAAGGGAVATGGGVVAAPQADAVAGANWLVIVAVGVPVLLLLGFLIYQAVMQADRAKAMKEIADG